MLPCRVPLVMGLLSIFLGTAAVPAHALAPSPVPVLHIEELGKGTVPIDGPWQFHLGDDPAWALRETPDSNWEQITADQPWGAQGHRSYTGYAWYRKHIDFSLAPGIPPEVYLLIREIDNVYEVYWDGQIVGHSGIMPPNARFLFQQPAQIVNLGAARNGVLAIRVWQQPLNSYDDGLQGGIHFPPIAGNLSAIQMEKDSLDYAWLRSRQYNFGLVSLYGFLMFLSLLGWLRNRSHRVLLAMTLFTVGPVLGMFLIDMRLPFSYGFALGWLQPALSAEDIGLWFLLMYLLELDANPRIARLTRNLAIIIFTSSSLDGLLVMLDWSQPWLTTPAQIVDAILTAIFTALEMYPLVLVVLALRKRLEASRWILAGAAFLAGMFSVIRLGVSQGSRFTKWTIDTKIDQPLFYINGNPFTLQIILNSLLLLAVIYAVYRYMRNAFHRQSVLEQELKSAREVQQVLIPETLPEIPGFAVTSAYHPAQQVGGDFFQIIPLEGEFATSTIVVVGDVSGKGLRAAMTVSLIVGTVRTLAKFVHGPAELLAELNQRLCGRLQGGFTTCIAMQLDRNGSCTVSSAGHPAPYLNQREIDLPGAVPLGIIPGQLYCERVLELEEDDRIALYTDGLLEARNANGEIFSFDRLNALFAARPAAAEARDAAITFGQDDDITVLTLTRLASGERSSTRLTVPTFAST